MPKGKGKTHPDIIRARERELEPVRLRQAGVEYHDIGDRLGISESGAYRAVKRVLARVMRQAKESQAENLEMDLRRLNAMLVGLWPKVLAGDPQAVVAALRILERRARMLGYDAPAKVAPTTPDGEKPWSMDGLSAEEIAQVRAEVERLMVEAVKR
jgi:predicted DNA-binding protein (UPF0251 family)